MNSGVSKARTPRSRVKQSRALQENPGDVAASTGAELPVSQGEQPQVIRDRTRDQLPQSGKRQLDTTSEIYPSLAKKARFTWTSTQQPVAQDEEVEQMANITLRQPKPNPPQRPRASFLEDFADSDPRPMSTHTLVSEWLESLEADRGKSCRSDSHLYYSDSDIISRQLTRSAPEMGHTRDTDDFVLPPKPASLGSRSCPTDTGSVVLSGISSQSSGRSPVEDPLYRHLNLAANGIYMRDMDEKLPDNVANLIIDVGKGRESPGPSQDSVRNDADLRQLEMGAGEPEVKEYFRSNIYPYPKSIDTLRRSDRQPISKYAVPNTGSKLRVNNPVPDMLYGYSHNAFSQQQAQLISLGAEAMANNQGLIYPFFAIEFTGDGPSGGGTMWAATNQCLGGSTSCVNIVERLGHPRGKYTSDKARLINSAVFSIAMSGTEARLYISWKHNEHDYYMRKVKSFLLQEPEHYLEFSRYVRNIIDWGKGTRLDGIRDFLAAF
ncbi:hypothetical protein AAE478_009296 [Parahypoxylon ruwenzoriense]